MKEFLDNIHTPAGWEENLNREIERRESRRKIRFPKLALQLTAGVAAVCTAFALIFAIVPRNDGYILLLSAEQVTNAVLGLDNMKKPGYDGDDNYTNAWYEYPNGMASDNGKLETAVYAQMPARVFGDNIRSVTFIPTNRNDGVSVSIVKHISGETHGPGTAFEIVDSYYGDETGEDWEYGEEMASLTLDYDSQFDRNAMYALKWEFTEALEYDGELGNYRHNLNGDASQKAVRTTAVDIEIRMTDGSVKFDSIDVFLNRTMSSSEANKVYFRKGIYAEKKSFFDLFI